jgi:phosphoribosylformylglycinamidine synthase PurS subunit
MSQQVKPLSRWIIEAEVMPKQGVNDPQGDAIMSGLKSLGFANTNRVRCGKLIRVELDADSEARAREQGTLMCQKLLANPVIESFTLTVLSPVEGNVTE